MGILHYYCFDGGRNTLEFEMTSSFLIYIGCSICRHFDCNHGVQSNYVARAGHGTDGVWGFNDCFWSSMYFLRLSLEFTRWFWRLGWPLGKFYFVACLIVRACVGRQSMMYMQDCLSIVITKPVRSFWLLHCFFYLPVNTLCQPPLILA